MKSVKIVASAVVLVLGLAWYLNRPEGLPPPGNPLYSNRGSGPMPHQMGAGQPANAGPFVSGREVIVSGTVTRILADDRDGSPHQRFVIRMARGQTLLVAHNLDLAERLDGLRVGDTVEVRGEYEWNDQGGVLHWTHDDPGGQHPAGYIDWNGRRYQ